MPNEALAAIVKELVGEEAVQLIQLLSEQEETTDDELIAKTGMKLNNLRKLLYQLFEQNLVSYRRVRDKEAGWFKYYWRINKTGLNILLNSKKKKILNRLKERLQYETSNVFFVCSKDSLRLSFEDAMETNFQCPTCGGKLESLNNQEIIFILEKKIREIEENLQESG
ncbi:MAG: transcription factor E [Candidatus Verstraetearchaeota archaeon]|nr:transcription factor E [Candidatus Verstraetearchaeota archaeon]